MAENNSSTMDQAQVLTIGLVVIAVLLAAIIGVLWFQGNKNAALDQSAALTAGAQTQQTAQTGAQAPAGMGGGNAAAETPFDPKTATKVPAGTEPLAFVKAYHEAIAANKYADAYKMLPLDKQKSYGSVAAYEEQLKGYGITGYTLGKPVTEGDKMTIAAEQVTPQMPITYTWGFKKVDGTWYVESRAMGGSVK